MLRGRTTAKTRENDYVRYLCSCLSAYRATERINLPFLRTTIIPTCR
jgi:hypothetical protein